MVYVLLKRDVGRFIGILECISIAEIILNRNGVVKARNVALECRLHVPFAVVYLLYVGKVEDTTVDNIVYLNRD